MKKAILTIGLFTLVLATTSFASPNSKTSSIIDYSTNTPIDGTGGQDTGRDKKLDVIGNVSRNESINQLSEIDGTGGQDTGRDRKLD
jgi:hypothetical protein